MATRFLCGLEMTLFKSPILVLDTETTGFADRDWSRVIELAAVVINETGEEIAQFESFIRPDILDERAAKALEINHITPEMLAGAPDTAYVASRFMEWYALLPDPMAPRHGGVYCTAFNIGFDRVMVERMGLTELRWASCVMERASKIMGEAGLLARRRDGNGYLWPKLSAAAEHFDVPVVGTAHRALTDARTAAGVMIAIRRRELAG